MGRGRDFRGPRRRGFDDEGFSPYDNRGFRPPPERGSSFGGRSEPMMAEGPEVDATVKWFNPEKGFGFVELADGTGDAFLHIAVLQSSGRTSVSPGAKIKAKVGQGQKGRQVTQVIDVDESTATPQAPRGAPREGGMRGGPGGGFGGGPGGGMRRRAPDPSTAVELTGTVKWFNPDKGFGFVAAETGGKDVFVHASVLDRSGVGALNEGQRVSMQVVEGQKGREAISVTLI